MTCIEFDEYSIDLELFRLTKAGNEIHLGAKPLNLLIYLIENRERVVSRAQLQEKVWGGVSVSEATIPTCILEVRRALSDSAASPRFIQSHRARGYRFTGDIRRVANADERGGTGPRELPFVGRRAELSSLARSADSVAQEKHGRVALVVGEAGIGKSRTVAEFTGRLDPRFKSLSMKAPTIAGMPAFWPWTQLVNRLRATQHATSMPTGKFLPLVPEPNPGSANPSSQSRGTHRFNVYSQWTELICAAAQSDPTILSVDDAHLLDSDSLLLLYWVSEAAANTSLLVTITSRPSPQASTSSDILRDIASFDHTSSLRLGPLSSEDIAELLDPLSGDRTKAATDLATRSGGNAFYATQLVRAFNSGPTAENDPKRVTPPRADAKEIVSQQLAGLPRKTRRALDAASVLGDQFAPANLAAIASTSPAALVAHLQPAVDQWILSDTSTGYTFRHSILRESLYSALSSTDRRSYHQRAALFLVRSQGASANASEIATHFLTALPLGDPTEALEFCIQAARDASSQFAYSQAMQFLERALDIQNNFLQSCSTERCATLTELAQATLYANDREKARQLLFAASDLARQARSGTALASCALTLAPDYLAIEVGTFDRELVDLIQEALDLLEADDEALRAKLIARLSQALQWSPDSPSGRALAEEAVSLAKSAECDDALISALTAHAEALHGPLHARERVGVLKELGHAAERTSDFATKILRHTRMITAYLELGEIEKIEVENRKHEALANLLGLPQFRWYTGATKSMLALMKGDIEAAERHSDEYRDVAGSDPDLNFKQTFACQFALRQIELDRTPSLIKLFYEFSESQKAVRSWRAAFAWALWESGDNAGAKEILRDFSAEEISRLAAEAGGGIGLASLAEVAAHIGSRDVQETLASQTFPLRGHFASAGYGVAYFGSFARYDGLLAMSLGDIAHATESFEIAVENEERNGSITWQIYALLDLDRAAETSYGQKSPVRSKLTSFSKDQRVQKMTRANRLLHEHLSNREVLAP